MADVDLTFSNSAHPMPTTWMTPGLLVNHVGNGLGSPIPPIVTSVSPTPGIIGANTPISFDVTDENNSFKRIILVAYFPVAKIKEIILDGNGFGPMYSNGSNSQTVITNGFHYTVLRDGGWLPNDGPVITPFVLDTTGEENV